MAEEMQLDGFLLNRESYHSLILSAMRLKNLQDVMHYFDEMRTSGHPPDNLIYIFVITACVQCNNPSEAFQVVQMMEEAGFQPSIQVFTGLLNACAASGDVEKAQSVVARMEEAGLAHTPYTAAALIDTYKNKRPKYRELLAECENIKEASRRFHPSRKVPSRVFHSMMAACVSLGNYEKAVQMLGEMKEEGLEPEAQTLHCLVLMYLSQGQIAQATELLVELRSKGVKPNMETYTELIRGTLRKKTTSIMEDAFKILAMFEEDGGSFNTATVNWLLPLASHSSIDSLDFAHAVWDRIVSKPIVPAKEPLFSYLRAVELRAPEMHARKNTVREIMLILGEYQEEKRVDIYTQEAANHKINRHTPKSSPEKSHKKEHKHKGKKQQPAAGAH